MADNAKKITLQKFKKFSLTIPQTYDDSLTFYEQINKINSRIDAINTRLTALDGQSESTEYSDYITDSEPSFSKYSLTLPQSYDDSITYYEQVNNLAYAFNQLVDQLNDLEISGMTSEQIAQLNKATSDIVTNANAIAKNAENLTSEIERSKAAEEANATAITTETNARTSADNAINQRLTNKADKSDTVSDVSMTQDGNTYTFSQTKNGTTTEIGKVTAGTGTGDVTTEQFNALSEKVTENSNAIGTKANTADALTGVTITNENGVYTFSETKNGTTTEIGTVETSKSNNPLVELKDSVVSNDTTGYDFHTITETTEDGTENEVGKFYLAQKQVTDISKSDTGLTIKTVDQSGTESESSIEVTGSGESNNLYHRSVKNVLITIPFLTSQTSLVYSMTLVVAKLYAKKETKIYPILSGLALGSDRPAGPIVGLYTSTSYTTYDDTYNTYSILATVYYKSRVGSGNGNGCYANFEILSDNETFIEAPTTSNAATLTQKTSLENTSPVLTAPKTNNTTFYYDAQLATDIGSLDSFSATENYKRGDLVYYNGKPYRAKSDVSAGAWDSSNFNETSIFEELTLRPLIEKTTATRTSTPFTSEHAAGSFALVPSLEFTSDTEITDPTVIKITTDKPTGVFANVANSEVTYADGVYTITNVLLYFAESYTTTDTITMTATLESIS